MRCMRICRLVRIPRISSSSLRMSSMVGHREDTRPRRACAALAARPRLSRRLCMHALCSCCDDRTATRIDVVFTHIYSAHYANSGALCIACQVGPFQGASFRRSRVGPQTVVGLSRTCGRAYCTACVCSSTGSGVSHQCTDCLLCEDFVCASMARYRGTMVTSEHAVA